MTSLNSAVLASAREPVDPMEKAIHDLGGLHLAGSEHLHGGEWQLVRAYGLRPGLLAMSHAWHPGSDTAEFIGRHEGRARSGGRSVPSATAPVWPH